MTIGLSGGFDQAFTEQVDFFRAKLNLPTERWDDIMHGEHDRAFVVAGATKADLLADLRAAVDKAISTGTSIETFRKDFRKTVADHGWQGWTGEGTPGGFGWRTRIIYETNLRSSYAAGRWAQLTDPDFQKLMPYWEYKHNDSVRSPRPQHLAWNGLTLLATHPFWRTHYPPNGWGCRCRIIARVRPLDNAITIPPEDWQRIDDKTGAPIGIDKGWAYAPGANRRTELQALVDTKAKALPAPLAEALRADAARVLNRSPDLASAVDRAARDIAAGELETVVILDPAGKVLLRKSGVADSVSLSAAELEKLPGAALVHNHPGAVPQSFSRDDIELAIHHRLAEIHAVDRLYQYSASAPAGAQWSPEYWRDTVLPVVQRVERDVAARLQAARDAGQIADDQYYGLLDHMIWTEVSQEINLSYQRIERKP